MVVQPAVVAGDTALTMPAMLVSRVALMPQVSVVLKSGRCRSRGCRPRWGRVLLPKDLRTSGEKISPLASSLVGVNEQVARLGVLQQLHQRLRGGFLLVGREGHGRRPGRSWCRWCCRR